jgi:hypothetical protein
MTEKQKQTADAIVNYFKEQDGAHLTLSQIDLKIHGKKVIGYAPTKPIISMLVVKGVLFHDKRQFQSGQLMNEDIFLLTPKGWNYESFDKLLDEENKKEKLIDRQIKSAIISSRSVTETNNSFQKVNTATLTNYRRQALLTAGNLLASIAAITISAYALFKGDSQEVRLLRKQLIEKSQIIDSIAQYQKGIDSSLKVYLERSQNKDTFKLKSVEEKSKN